jgi:Rrf2 family nitric oxide-sensitive transcriptional repressor
MYLGTLDEGKTASTREIGNACGFPLNSLCGAMKAMARVGMISAVRGVQGGYRLAKKPEDILVLDIAQLITRNCVRLVDCASGGECLSQPKCPSCSGMRVLHERVKAIFVDYTVADFIRDCEEGPKKSHEPVFTEDI